MLIVSICTFTFVCADELSLLGKIIYIDPGHGGRDPGAVYKDIRESDINLDISKALKDELEKQGALVYLTRNGDYDLSNSNASNHKRSDLAARARLINESDCDMFISIHLNSDSSSSWYGTQVFYTVKNPDNREIADIMERKFKDNLNTKREAKILKNMYLFDRINKPGVLVEAGFISNPNDRYLLKQSDYQYKIARIITDGVVEYLN